MNDKYYKSNGPVFLMIGGEGEARASWMVEGAWVHYAEELNALCIQLEHRFYGKSRPTRYVSLIISKCNAHFSILSFYFSVIYQLRI